MGAWVSPAFTALPRSVRESLVACVSEDGFDQRRYDAICGEHEIGLAEPERGRLLDDVYTAYVEATDSPGPASWRCDKQPT